MALSTEGIIAIVGLVVTLPSVYLALWGLKRQHNRHRSHTWPHQRADALDDFEAGHLNVRSIATILPGPNEA